MSFIADSRSSGPGGGFLTLRSENFEARGFSLAFREFVGAVSVEQRIRWPSGFGQYQYDRGSVGDIIGGCVWRVHPNNNQAREIPAWRFSTPVKTIAPDEVDGEPAPAPLCERDSGNPNPQRNLIGRHLRFSPIRDVEESNGSVWSADDRLLPDRYKNPGCAVDRTVETWSNMPAGVYGVSMIPNEESGDFKRMFLPTDPRLICVSENDPTWSTLVADCEGWEISTLCNGVPADTLRVASLQSFARVIPHPLTAVTDCPISGPFLALQAVIDPCELTGAGCISFQTIGHGRKYVGGMISSPRYKGPLHPGHSNDDKHKLATDVDGNSINSLHIAHDFFLYQSKDHDGPLKIDGDFSAVRGVTAWEVDLVWDSSQEYTFCGQRKFGKWRWEAWTGEDEYSSPPSSGGPFNPFTFFSGIFWDAINDRPPPPGGGGPVFYDPIGAIYDARFPAMFANTTSDGEPAISYFDPEDLSEFPIPEDRDNADLGEVKKIVVRRVGNDDSESRSFLLAHKEKAFPAIMFRPQFFHAEAVDLRYSKLREAPTLIDWSKQTTPLVARLECFGLQSELAWNYGVEPEDLSGRYRPGTSNGLIAVLPAEMGLEDYLDAGKLAQKLTKSGTTGILFPDNSGVYFGRPSFTDSNVMLSDGYRIRYVEPTKELRFSYYDGSTETALLKFLTATTLIQFPGWNVDITDDLSVGQDLDVGSTALIQGAATLQDTLSVDGAATLKSTVNCQGAVDCDSTLNVDGASTLVGNVTVTGDCDFNGYVAVNDLFRFDDSGNKTVSTGVITITGAFHSVSSEGASTTDNLDTINGGGNFEFLILKLDSGSSQSVQLTDGTGNLNLELGNFTLTNQADRIFLHYDADVSKWVEVSRSNNA